MSTNMLVTTKDNTTTKELIWLARKSTRPGLYHRLANRLNYLSNALETARNELCLKCGKYHNSFKGECDGCRWYNLEEVLMNNESNKEDT